MQIRKTIKKYSKSKLARGSTAFLIMRLTGMVFGYINIIIISKYFGASALGIFSYIISILTLTGAFISVGIPMTTLKFVSKFKAKKEFGNIKSYYYKAIQIVFVPGIILSLLFFFFPDFIAGNIFNKPENAFYIKLFAFILIPISIKNINAQFVRAFEKIGQFGFLNFFITPFTVIFLIFIIFFTNNRAAGTPITVHFISLLLIFIVSAVLILFLKKWRTSQITEKVRIKEILKVSASMFFVVIAGATIKWADKIILGFYVSNADIGIYHAMYRTAVLLNIVLLAVNSGLGPRFSELFELKKIDKLKQLVHKSTKIITLLTFLLFVLIIIFAKYIAGFILDTEIEKGLYILYILAIGQMISAWSGPVGIFLLMSGNEKINQNTSIIIAVFFILLNTVLVYFYGIIGSAIAVSTVMVFKNVIYVVIVKRKYNILFLYIPKPIKNILKLR